MMKKLSPDIHFKIFYNSLCIGLLLFPFSVYPMFPISLILLANWLIEGKWREKWKRVASKPYSSLFIAFISFFIVCFIGIFYDFNFNRAAIELGAKAWFFLAPLFIFTADKKLLTQNRIEKLFLCFFISCGIMMLLNFSISFIQYLQTGNHLYFYYKALSHFVPHPTFCALYICFCLLLNIHFLFFSRFSFRTYQKKLLYLSFILWIVSIIMLQSKAGILAFSFCGLFFGIYLIIWKKAPKWNIPIFIITFLGIMYIGNALTPTDRMGKLLQSRDQSDDHQANPTESSFMRLKIWSVSAEVAWEHLPFGVGTGNVKDYLVPKYEEHGYTYLAERRSNPHNQYLQVTIDTGIPGILSLLALFLIPLFYCIKKKDIIYLFFLLIVLFNMLFDSILERRMGCDIIAILNCLFCFKLIFLSPQQDEFLETEKD